VKAQVPLAHNGFLPGLGEPGGGERPDRFEQSVPSFAVVLVGHHQGLVDQTGKRAQHLFSRHRRSATDLGRRVQTEGAGEHRQSPQQGAVDVVQQRVAPADRPGHRLLAALGVARTSYE
jgi:hypothetical protein